MIGVRLMGGLGNQMFQYAAARSLAEKNGTEPVMDLVFFDNIVEVDTPRDYELDCFNIKQTFLPHSRRPIENPRANYLGKRGFLRNIKHAAQGKAWHIYSEPHHNFDKNMLKQPNKTYLVGYWQTEKYFKHIRNELLDDFTFVGPVSKNVLDVLANIENSESISLHVRRGDYISNKHANAFHGTKDLAYYNNALKPILSRVKDPTVFVISDEPQWCKKNLKFSQKTVFIEGNKKGCDDLRLMSKCKHNVIANSSFSWWGAWLNQNRNKIVSAPKEWFNNQDTNTKDVVPAAWIKV